MRIKFVDVTRGGFSVKVLFLEVYVTEQSVNVEYRKC